MVSSESIRTGVGILGNVISMGLFFSPLPTFVKIWKRGSVEEFSAMPYLATLLNCMIWILYALPIVHPNSNLVLTINGAGVAVELAYIVLFLTYSRGKRRLTVLAVLLLEVLGVGLVAALVLSLAHTRERRSMIAGVLGVSCCILMYAAPLSVMKLVVKTKSVEYMPLYLSVAFLFNSICWTVYALIRFDLYIIIPNVLGMIFAVVQLIMYAAYYKSTKRQMEARKKAEVRMTEVVV